MKIEYYGQKVWQTIILIFWIHLVITAQLFSQATEDLLRLQGSHTSTYYSKGSQSQAEEMARRCDDVIAFYKPLLQFEPTVKLYVLSKNDWGKYTEFPVYGMPHYNDAQTLIVASEDNDFWRSFIPPLDHISVALAQTITQTYTHNQQISLRPFFDLLAIHELGHAFHVQGGLQMQRQW